MRFIRSRVLAVAVLWLSAFATAATPPVTGNGFGFAVVSPDTGAVTKFYAHPYSFSRPDPQKPFAEGFETANFIKRLSWNDASAKNASIDYANDSQVLRVRSAAGEGTVFMPFGLQQNALLINWTPALGKSGHWEVEWNRAIKSQRMLRVSGVNIQVLRFEGIEESLLVIPLGSKPLDSKHDPKSSTKDFLSTNRAWTLISIESDSALQPAVREFQRWRAHLAPEALAKRELAEVERWRVKPPASLATDQQRHLWRQSEIVLRMAQSREPNRPGRYNNGLIVACLPDGSWFTPWVRDMAYAAVAFARMGHRDEARAALLAYFLARPTGKMRHETGGLDYQVSVVRYFGDGSEEPFFTMEGTPNIEFDDWGLVLWVLGEYLQRYDDPALLRTPTYRGPLYESARDFVAKPLLATLEPYGDGLIVAADTSIWEEHQKDKKHFAWTTALAIVGLRSFAEIAHRAHDEATRAELLQKIALLQKGFDAAFVRNGALHGTLEEGVKNDIDGALLAVIEFGVVHDPAVLRSTVERMELLKVASGGYRRVRGTYTDPSIYEYWYEQQEFLFVDFSLAEVYRRLGRPREADAILQRIVQKAATDHDFIPEMYVAVDCPLFHGEIGAPTGAIPMVGYGAGIYILDVLQQSARH